jgi:hypothetical protein
LATLYSSGNAIKLSASVEGNIELQTLGSPPDLGLTYITVKQAEGNDRQESPENVPEQQVCVFEHAAMKAAVSVGR